MCFTGRLEALAFCPFDYLWCYSCGTKASLGRLHRAHLGHYTFNVSSLGLFVSQKTKIEQIVLNPNIWKNQTNLIDTIRILYHRAAGLVLIVIMDAYYINNIKLVLHIIFKNWKRFNSLYNLILFLDIQMRNQSPENLRKYQKQAHLLLARILR